jgi:hypothetical protein
LDNACRREASISVKTAIWRSSGIAAPRRRQKSQEVGIDSGTSLASISRNRIVPNRRPAPPGFLGLFEREKPRSRAASDMSVDRHNACKTCLLLALDDNNDCNVLRVGNYIMGRTESRSVPVRRNPCNRKLPAREAGSTGPLRFPPALRG